MATGPTVTCAYKFDTQNFPCRGFDTPSLRILLVQSRAGRIPWNSIQRMILTSRPQVVLFPEYAWYPSHCHDFKDALSFSEQAAEQIRQHTIEWDCLVIAGTLLIPEGNSFFGQCNVYFQGRVQALYRKINPTEREQSNGMRPGNLLTVYHTGHWRWSLLICSDIFHPTLFDRLRQAGTHIVFMPTASPYRPNESIIEKFQRDKNYYQESARRMGGYVVKCCLVGDLFGVRYQGRSLIASPDKIYWRVPPEEEMTEVVSIIELPLPTGPDAVRDRDFTPSHKDYGISNQD